LIKKLSLQHPDMFGVVAIAEIIIITLWCVFPFQICPQVCLDQQHQIKSWQQQLQNHSWNIPAIQHCLLVLNHVLTSFLFKKLLYIIYIYIIIINYYYYYYYIRCRMPSIIWHNGIILIECRQ
jgi:hypothetical protein